MAKRPLFYYISARSAFDKGLSAGARPSTLTLLDKIAEAASAGVDYIQLREKDLSTRELENLAREAVAVIRKEARENSSRTKLLLNSRVDIALAVEADGVHLRSDDLSPGDVRAIAKTACGADRAARLLVAVSCHSIEEVERAASDGADFAVFGPVFEKNGKPGAQPKGLAALREVCRAKIPVLALGGVTLENAPSCLEAGAAGLAGIRLFQENKISEVMRALG